MRLDKLLGARHEWLRYDAMELFVCLGCKREVTDKAILEVEDLRKRSEKRAGVLQPFWSDCPTNPRKAEELEGRMISFD